MSESPTKSNQRGIREAVRSLLLTVPGIGKVECRQGGLPSWATRAGALQAYWLVRVGAVSEERHSLGGRATSLEESTVLIDGWTPLSYERDSDGFFDDLTSRVRDALREHTTLQRDVSNPDSGILFSALPQVRLQDLHTLAAGQAGEVVCHHILFESQVTRRIRYATS